MLFLSAGDSLSRHNGYLFSAFDKDQDSMQITVPNYISGHFGTQTVTMQTPMVCIYGVKVPPKVPLVMFGKPGRVMLSV